MVETVSIVMPAYNAALHIKESIESVIEQTFIDWRLYIVDDASIDNTKEVVCSFHDSRIEYIKLNSNAGVSAARNTAIKVSKGTYIAFLDSDDIWSKDKLQQQVDILRGGYDIVCSCYQTFRGTISNVNSLRSFPECFEYKDMLVNNKIGNLTGIYNQEKLGKIYQKTIGHEDYVMWLELVSKTNFVYCIQTPLAYYRVSENSLSGNKVSASMWQWSIYRNELGFSMIKSGWYWLRYMCNAILR